MSQWAPRTSGGDVSGCWPGWGSRSHRRRPLMRRPRSTATRTEVMPAPLILDPLAVFTAPQLRQALGLRPSSLRRQIREYGLVVCKRAGRYFFLGSDVLDWLSAG